MFWVSPPCNHLSDSCPFDEAGGLTSKQKVQGRLNPEDNMQPQTTARPVYGRSHV